MEGLILFIEDINYAFIKVGIGTEKEVRSYQIRKENYCIP